MGNCENLKITCVALKAKIENGKLEDNRIEVQTNVGDIKITVPEPVISTGSYDLMDIIKQHPIAKDATVKTTSRFDSQAIRLEDSLRKISAKEQKEDLMSEKEDLEDDNRELEAKAESFLIEVGYDLEDFEPQYEIPDYIRDALEENGVLDEYEDICDMFDNNDMRIEEINELLSSSEKINLTENFCKQNPEVQSKLDEIIRSASFSSIYTHFTAFKSSKDCDYEYDTKKIMEFLSLEFCDVVNGKIDFTYTDFYYQALKDMAYELYKSIPGEECKED